MGQQVKVENVRVMWPHILKPQTSKQFPNNPPSYSIQLILDDRLQAQVGAAINAVKGSAESSSGKQFTLPPSFVKKENGTIELRAGAREDQKPHVVDEFANDVIDPSKIYPGCYCNVYIDVYSSTSYGNKVSVGLLGVQFAADGEPLDGRPTKEDLFGKSGAAAPEVNPFS